jgi:hypothetical protein
LSDPRSYIIGITAFFLALMPAVSFGQTDRLSDQSTIQAKEEVTIEEIDTALGQLEASTDLDDPTKVRLQEYYTQAKSELESEATQQNSAACFNVTLASFLTGEQVSGREVVHCLPRRIQH